MQLKIMIAGKEQSCEVHDVIVPYVELSACPVVFRLIPLPSLVCGDCCLDFHFQYLWCHKTELWLCPLNFNF